MIRANLNASSLASLEKVLRAFANAGMSFDLRVRNEFGFSGNGSIKGRLFVGSDSEGATVVVDIWEIGSVGEISIGADGSLTEILGGNCSDLEMLALEIADRKVNVGLVLYG